MTSECVFITIQLMQIEFCPLFILYFVLLPIYIQFVFNVEELPEWISVYFVKTDEYEMRCNLCDNVLKTEEKSLDLLEHMKDVHKDVYDLHKENPDATVGFRIEFLHLNMLKDDNDPKVHPVILGEVCETTTEEPQKEIEFLTKEHGMEYVLIDNSKKKEKRPPGPRKRSWVWKYFERMSNIIYRCKLCNVVLSIKGCNSNNMNRHVRTRHPTIFKNELGKRDGSSDLNLMSNDGETPYVIKTEEIYASDKDFEASKTPERQCQKMRRSWIWSYFDRLSRTMAQCKLCKRNICHGGNATGNMNRHLKMIHHTTTSYESNWAWKVFENTDDNYFTCKICHHQCMKYSDPKRNMITILGHLKQVHGVVSGDQIITGADVVADEN